MIHIVGIMGNTSGSYLLEDIKDYLVGINVKFSGP